MLKYFFVNIVDQGVGMNTSIYQIKFVLKALE